ncbi:MAG: porin [Deltaproteobacteria bacterium]|nr:porin [Deltaproteobacteria bacterium]
MRKVLAVIFAAALVCAFAMPAAAADLKISGQYFAEGDMNSNYGLEKEGTSTHIIFQRLRLFAQFQIAEGLEVASRFDIQERIWNGSRSANIEGGLQENIQFDRSYVTFATAAGKFGVGYQPGGCFGTPFADAGYGGNSQIKYWGKFGAVGVGLYYEKSKEGDYGNAAVQADDDRDLYTANAIYKMEGIEIGLEYKYQRDASNTAAGYRTVLHGLNPYLKGTFGPLYVEAEAIYVTGTLREYEADMHTPDVDASGLGYYVMAKANLGPASVGASYSYIAGDDAGTADKNEGAYTIGNMSTDYNPLLLLWNDTWTATKNGPMGTYSTTTDAMANAKLFTVFAGFKPMEKLNVAATFGYALADEQGSNVSDKIGTEFDVTATYKIYDQLSYMVGFAYFWTGDWYKGANTAHEVDNNYLLMHRITVNF